MRISACTHMTLAAFIMVLIGCAEPPFRQPGAAVPPSL